MKKLIFVILLGAIGGGAYFYQEDIKELIGSDEDVVDDYVTAEEAVTETAYMEPEPETTEPAANAAPTLTKAKREFWEKQGTNWKKFKYILIDDVRVTGNSALMSKRDQQMLGAYFKNAMENAVQSKKYKLATKVGKDVILVRTVISSIEGGGNDGTVTMRGFLLDSSTGGKLVSIKDTKSGSLFSDMAIWGDITKGFDNWANQLAGLLGNKLGKMTYEAPKTKSSNEVLELLADAEQNLFANRLTSPKEDNALYLYREALRLDPKNKQAKNGIVKIVKKYVSWGHRAMNDGDEPRAWRSLDKARDILDTDPSVLGLERRLMGGVVGAAPTMAAAPAAAPAPEAAPAAAASEEKTPDAPATAKVDTPAPKPAAAAAPVAADPWGGKPGAGSASLTGGILKPFMLGLETTGDVAAITAAAKTRLKKQGFEIAGSYAPYSGTQIIVVTSADMKAQAAKSKMGAYGAVARVSISKVGERVQVSYTNPIYLQGMYRMKGNLSGAASKLSAALGHQKAFGSKTGLAPKKLKKWHYMFGMPYFDDADEFGSSSAAKVVAGAKAGKGGSKFVYKVDIGNGESIIGVGLSSGSGADKTVMGSIDKGAHKHAAHLPYEIVISGGKAYALNGKFRIALSFPDLTMGQFASISSAPGAISDSLKAVSK